ncbi:MAG: ThuA domain-containing protein [Planctomycetaceae bacterium]
MLNRLLLATAVALAAMTAGAADDAGKKTDGDKPRILFVTQSAGFVHGSVKRQGQQLAPAEIAMRQLAQQTGEFEIDATQDVAADFTKENLANYNIVMFYTTLDLPIAKEDLEYFLNDWLKQPGHGFIGVHSASDTYHDYEPYWDMVGGTFDGHPWGAGETVTLAIHEPDHPTMKPFGGESVEWIDEIYQYKHWQPEKVRVLMSLDMAKTKLKKPYHVPVAWVKNYGEGRIYYNNLGHREDTWTKKPFLDSLLAGIKWVSGEIDGPAEPNPEVSAKQEQLAKEAAGG